MDQIFLVVALGFLMVMMFMSSRKRKKQAEQLQSTIGKGATVMLTSGIIGTITAIDGENIIIDSEGSKLKVVKLAVRSVVESAKPAATATKPVTAKKPASASASKSAVKPVAKKPAAKKPAAKKPAAKRPAAKKTSSK